MKLSQTSQFKKDIQKQAKRGKDIKNLLDLVNLLLYEKTVPQKHKDHPLKGHWRGRRDCHIEPDWILIYRKTEDELRLERTGTHSELF